MLNMSPITTEQWKKVIKALYYSAGSGFAGGFALVLSGILPGVIQGSTPLIDALTTALIVGGFVGALNSIAVTVKQLFTDSGK